MLPKSSKLTKLQFYGIAARFRSHTRSEAGKYAFGSGSTAYILPACRLANEVFGPSFALSGSNQAREGRLVDALAVRGDEGRDTLR